MIGNLQRIQIKIGSNAPPELTLDAFLGIFVRWRQDKNHPAGWIDLADYAHVPRGPGIVLIGQQCNFAFDMGDPGPGILYAAKKGLAGSHRERIFSAMRCCLKMAQRLVGEEEFPSGVELRTDSLTIRFPDRLETPHTAVTDGELQPAVREVLDALYGRESYRLAFQDDPKQSYGFSVRAGSAESLDVLLKRVAKASGS